MTVVTFSDEQREIINTVMEDKRNVFIQGQAGVGKTAVLNEIISECNKMGKYVVVSATTGIAAINFPSGRTLHSVLNAGLKGTRRLTLPEKEELAKIELLIVDEVSMLTGEYFNAIYKHIKNIQLVFCGDLLQLPPVKGSYCFTVPAWEKCKFKIVIMNVVFRQDNVKYKKALTLLRHA